MFYRIGREEQQTQNRMMNSTREEQEPQNSLMNSVRQEQKLQKQWGWGFKYDSDADSSTPVSVTKSTTSHMDDSGAWVTKTVIQKKFADGREENNTNVEKRKPSPLPVPEQVIAPSASQQSSPNLVRDQVSRSGWFWSK
ncbi:hypothetical protein BT63DRAFT_421491 [Microthyrium microscopicum]|uniref:Uncharacterized protein n=1 Tax=Microthyrium microscopicum TaxID=703497 RepID=A0A6A6UPF7_9PEZI|nr:hypothetical protein BT63DRAFT_421491 [Microthyrium microscopicum]